MFAGKRTSVTDHKIRSFFHELAEFDDSFFRLQIEVESRMHAGVTEVAVE